MDEVADGLFVGTVNDAGTKSVLCEYDIDSILSLVHQEPADGFPADVTVETIPMLDGPRNDRERFERAVLYVLSHLETGDNVLVHCSAGASRSPTVAATAIALTNGVGLESAFAQVASRRDAVDPHDALVRQAAHIYTEHAE